MTKFVGRVELYNFLTFYMFYIKTRNDTPLADKKSNCAGITVAFKAIFFCAVASPYGVWCREAYIG